MPEPLSAHLDLLATEVRAARQVLLFLDFDGTLVPIRDRPEGCFLEPAHLQTLVAIGEIGHISVAIVSGRKLDDVAARVGVEGFSYAGNHGLEIRSPDFSFCEPVPTPISQSLDMLVGEIAAAIFRIPGAWIEHKGLTASIHYREVEHAHLSRMAETVNRVVAPAIARGEFVLRRGKAVFDLRPAVEWNKGTAVRKLARRLSLNGDRPLLIYFGDDDTDEDAFLAIPEGLTVRVGATETTSAKYFVSDSTEVHSFVDWLGRIVGSQRLNGHASIGIPLENERGSRSDGFI